jgi:hypothetical protein
LHVNYYTQISPTGASILRILLGELNPSQAMECIDYIEELESYNLGNFCLYNAIKYLWRLGAKSGAIVEELNKCRDYVTRYADRIPPGDLHWISVEQVEMTIDVIDRIIALELLNA